MNKLDPTTTVPCPTSLGPGPRGEWAAAGLVELLVVDGDSSASKLVWDDDQRARIRRGSVLDQTRHEVLVQRGVNFLRQN